MKKFTHRQVVEYSIAAVLILFAITLGLAYFTSLRDPITVTFKRIYPAAIVGKSIVSINDVEQAGKVGDSLQVNIEQAKQSYLNSVKSQVLARQLKLTIPNDAAADEMRFYTVGNETDYKALLKNSFGGSEHFFNKYVITPHIFDAYLRMKYYSDIKSTSPEYKKAQDILARIKKGEKFEDIAKTESQDMISGHIGGDLGFYESGQIVPELDNQVSISALGEVRQDIIISRLGYHIVYPVEYSNVNGTKKWHLKHILLVPTGYDAWLKTQQDKISIKYIKKM